MYICICNDFKIFSFYSELLKYCKALSTEKYRRYINIIIIIIIIICCAVLSIISTWMYLFFFVTIHMYNLLRGTILVYLMYPPLSYLILFHFL